MFMLQIKNGKFDKYGHQFDLDDIIDVPILGMSTCLQVWMQTKQLDDNMN